MNDIMKDKLRQFGEQYLRYNLNKWVRKGTFDILNDIIKNVTMVQFTYNLGNVNDAISKLGY